MTPITQEDMRAIAERITGKPHQVLVMAYGYRIVSPNARKQTENGFSFPMDEEFYEFSPKLDGTDREKAQALDCIVAAFKLREGMECSKTKNGYRFLINDDDHELFWPYPTADDLLSASLLAIREATR